MKVLLLLPFILSAVVAAGEDLPWWLQPQTQPQQPPAAQPSNPNPGLPPSDGDFGGGGGGDGGGGTDGGGGGEVNPFEESSYDPCECGPGKSCLCVLYYLCVNETILSTGSGLLDDRLSKPKVENCPGVQKCCREPLDNEIDLPPTPSVPPFIPDNTPTPPTVPPKSGCGVRRSPQSPNYDNTTSFSEFPWMLIVMQAEYVGDGSPPVDVFKCGASLIHPQVALTAAHCVHQILPSDLTVRAGEWDAQSSSEPLEAQDRRVSRVIKHPGFEKETLFNDIALLILDSPMKEAPNVDVTCLPQSTDDYTGVRCLATGWGTPRPDLEVFQTTLKKVEVPIVDRPSCQKRLRTTRLGRFFQLHKSFICAGGEPGVDTCKGTNSPPPHGLEPLVPNSGNTQFTIGFGHQKPHHVPEGHSLNWNHNTNQNPNIHQNANGPYPFRPPQNPYHYNYFYNYYWGRNANGNSPRIRSKRSDAGSDINTSRNFQISFGVPPGQSGTYQSVPFVQGSNSQHAPYVQNQGSQYVPVGHGDNSHYVPFNHNHGPYNVPIDNSHNDNGGSYNVPFDHSHNHHGGSYNVPFVQGGNSYYKPFDQNYGPHSIPVNQNGGPYNGPIAQGGNSQYGGPYNQQPGSQNVPFSYGGGSPSGQGGDLPNVHVIEIDESDKISIGQDGKVTVIPSDQVYAGHNIQIEGQAHKNHEYGNSNQQSIGEQDSLLEVTGDGGGPLFCPSREDPGRYIQVGVVSWGIGCGGTDTPAVYSSVPFFRDWVDDQLLVNGFENIAVPPVNVENEERIKN